MQDLLRWHFPDGRSRVRRGWGLGYHGRDRQPDEAPPLEGS